MTVAEEFRAEGRDEATIEITRNMIRSGVKTSFVLDVSGLTLEKLDKIKAEMGSGS